MKSFKLGSLTVDPAEYASHGNAVLGIRGSGKTYTATLIAERLFDAGIPFIAFDPIGVWRHLRVPGAGKGYPIVVAGGKDGDLPLTVAGVPAIVRAAMQGGVSVVLDLFDMNLSKADWRRIVTEAVRTLMHENHAHGLRHVFIEEAAEFIPQKPIDWVVYAEIEKMARMGGNSRLGYTLINQRSQEVSKAILELCENVFLHRQRGKNALENMDKWLQVAGAAEQKEIIKSLPDLPQGECWAWLGGDTPTPPTHIKVPAKNSAHPDRRVMRGDTSVATAKPVDVGQFVAGMRGQLEAIVEEAKANDPALLRARIKELEKKLAAPVDTMRPDINAELQAAHADGRKQGYAEGYNVGRLNQHERTRGAVITGLDAIWRTVEAEIEEATFQRVEAPHTPRGAIPPAPAPQVMRSAPPPQRQPGGQASDDLSRGERAVLTALAQFDPKTLPPKRAAAIAGYSVRASTWRGILAKLRQREAITGSDMLGITPAGSAALGAFTPLPTGRALLDHWLGQLPKGQTETLKVLAAIGGQGAASDVATCAGYSTSASTWRGILAGLRNLDLVEGSRILKLHEDLR